MTTEASDWIPVAESKPVNLQRVLVVQEFLPDEQEINLVRYMADVDGWMGSIGIIHYNVTHWQSLPEVPDEQRDLLDTAGESVVQ